MSSHRTGCTLVELLLLAAFLCCGVATAVSGGDRFGTVGYVGGFVLGIVGSFAGFAGVGFTICSTFGLLTGNPEFPECSNGKCQVRPDVDSGAT